MTNKKVFECSRNCKNCTYEDKKCGGFDEFSECISDKCPFGNYAIGNIDSVGGKHTNEGNWNPIGERCSLCAPKDCTNCDKWKRRQAENKTAPKSETPKKPSSNAAMWGAIFDDVYDLNDSPNTKTIIKDETITEEKPKIVEEATENVVEEIITETAVEEVTIVDETPAETIEVEEPVIDDVQENFGIEIEEPDFGDDDGEPEIPEDIDSIEETEEIKEVEQPKEEIKKEVTPKKKSIFDDDDDFDYSMFKNASITKWPNKPAIVIEESKPENEVEEETPDTDEHVHEIETETVAEIEEVPAVVDTTEEEVEATEETLETDETPAPIIEEVEVAEEEEKEVETPEPEAQKKLFDTSLFSKWFKRSKPVEPVETVAEIPQPKLEETNSEKTIEISENCDIIKEEAIPVSETKVEETIQIQEEIHEEESKPVYVANPGKNEYIKDSWLDDEESQDYDEYGNLIQGIYRIDRSGNRTIVTAFDDDTNVRYVKTNKPKVNAPLNTSGIRVVDTIADAWQVSAANSDDNIDNEENVGGIIEKTNQFPTAEVVEVSAPEENPILDEPKQEVEEMSEETTTEDIEDEGDDIDFGEDLSSDEDGLGFDDGYNDAMFEQDEIPEPEEYRAEREEYEEAGIEADEAVEVDEEYEDADFDMTDSAKFKASLLTPIGEEIAKLQINNNGVYLSVLGDCKITIKGRNDSDGFSYRDARRFPKYIIDKVLNKSIYRDPNMEVIDNTYFNLTYYEIKNGEIIPIDDVRLDVVFENPTPDSVKEVLYNEYKKLKNK